jgi:hypothetical protein
MKLETLLRDDFINHSEYSQRYYSTVYTQVSRRSAHLGFAP